MSKNWFVATTKHQQETLAAGNLREQGFGVYLPKRYWRQSEGKKIEPLSALRFTGYVFIAFDPAMEEHGPIGNTRGIDELLVSRTGSPLALQPGIVELLRRIEDEEFALAATRKKPVPRLDLRPGDAVRIDRRDHPAFGQQGHLLGTVRGLASVLSGAVVWKIADCDLKLVGEERRRVA